MRSPPNTNLLIFATLLSHWRRHKIQLITLIVGLASATTLWTAVQALNTHARSSYDRSADTVSAFDRPAIVSVDRTPFDEQAFADLRRAGLMVTPVIEGRLGSPAQGLQLTGIDPLTFGPSDNAAIQVPQGGNMLNFLEPPGVLFTNAQTAVKLERELADIPVAERPIIEINDDMGTGQVIGDIAVAQKLLGLEGTISKLLLPAGAEISNQKLPEQWQSSLTLVEPAVRVDLQGLTDSFHLNLTAFGLLCFLVGLFIVYSAIGLAIEDRISVLRTLRICGVSHRQLLTMLIGEMVLLAFIAGGVGVVAGYFVAAQLLPDVAASLRGLYGARVGGALTLDPVWLVGGLAVSVFGALLASFGAFLKVAGMSLFDTRGTTAWRTRQNTSLKYMAFATAAFGLLAVYFTLQGNSLVHAFIVMASVLLGGAFFLPVLLAVCLKLGQKTASGPISLWFWADSRQQLSGLSLALMALLLALGTNIGVSGMVEGFRQTFNAFLEERLSANLYVLANSNENAIELVEWAGKQESVSVILPIWGATGSIGPQRVTVTGFEDHTSYRETWSLLATSNQPWRDAVEGDGVLINEQLHYRGNLAIGDRVTIESERGQLVRTVSAIYSDYGNPLAEIRLPNAVVEENWPSSQRRRVALHSEGDIDLLREHITADLGIPADQMIDQSGLKGFSRSVFERTFVITGALSTLTLGVAGIAMITSLLTLASARLNGVAPLWAMGVSQNSIVRIEGLKILMLALLTALAAIPLGVAISWCLVAVINVEAFGWRLPLHFFPEQWLTLSGLGLVAAGIASLYPLIKLSRTPAASLSKVFSHEH